MEETVTESVYEVHDSVSHAQMDLLVQQASVLNENVVLLVSFTFFACCLLGVIVGFMIARGR